MTINFDKFVEWAESRFEDVIVKGKEIRINSIFSEDSKHHMWCSPSGGKKDRSFGVFHCFKTDEKGSLVKLVKMVDKCSREEALQTLSGFKTIAQLEADLNNILCDSDVAIDYSPTIQKIIIDLPTDSHLIENFGSNNWHRQKAEEYLSRRKIPIKGLYVCVDGKYKGRIIIPYFNMHGDIIYWNSRHMNPNAKLRYLGPPKDCGVGKEDVIYMAGNWPSKGSLVHICEGEFNAMSLNISELSAAACGGKNMSEKQAVMLAEYKVVVCLDRDVAGASGTGKMINMLGLAKSLNVKDKLMYVRPPDKYNDWNEMLVDCGPIIVNRWIETKKKPVDFSAPHGTAGDIIQFK